MIVKDEEKFVGKCILSVKPFVDEIVVADTGSKDNTQAIALALGAKVFQYRWGDDFSQARNFSLEKATKDWILVLDADENLSQGDLARIKSLLSSGEGDAFSFIQRNYYKDKEKGALDISSLNDTYPESKPYPGWFPSELVRLFRNHKGYLFSGRVHEVIEPIILERQGKILPTKIPIHHFKAEKPKAAEEAKDRLYLELGLRQIDQEPAEPKPYYEVGLSYLSRRDYQNAISYLERGLEIIGSSKKPGLHRNTLTYLILALARAYCESKEYEKAAVFLEKALRDHPHQELYFFQGLALTNLGRYAEAVNSYSKSLLLEPNNPESHSNLANLYAGAGMFDKAIMELQAAVRLAPDNSILYRNLGAAYAASGRYLKAKVCFQKAISLNKGFEAVLGEALQELEALLKQEKE
jgi:tetratricopeptide (TPR) repeat protein